MQCSAVVEQRAWSAVPAPGPASGFHGSGPGAFVEKVQAGPEGAGGCQYWPGSGGSSERFFLRLSGQGHGIGRAGRDRGR